jgi:hypothetical protein
MGEVKSHRFVARTALAELGEPLGQLDRSGGALVWRQFPSCSRSERPCIRSGLVATVWLPGRSSGVYW